LGNPDNQGVVHEASNIYQGLPSMPLKRLSALLKVDGMQMGLIMRVAVAREIDTQRGSRYMQGCMSDLSRKMNDGSVLQLILRQVS